MRKERLKSKLYHQEANRSHTLSLWCPSKCKQENAPPASTIRLLSKRVSSFTAIANLCSESEFLEKEVSGSLLLSGLGSEVSTNATLVGLKTYLACITFLSSAFMVLRDSGAAIFSSETMLLNSRSSLTTKRVGIMWL